MLTEKKQQYLNLLKKSLNKIKSLQEQQKSLADEEPIAIISMACRFPGGCRTPEQYWELLDKSKTGLRGVPKDRWDATRFYHPNPAAKAKIYLKELNFLQENIRYFDAELFGISPIEAEQIDPQHRMLLHLSWEAFERAGINPQDLAGSNTGVFVGIINSEYLIAISNDEMVSPYTITGCNPHMASGRISHTFDLRGPSVSIDTACSSSLTALHDACLSLRQCECNLALVGGANLILNENAIISLCQVRALSPDGCSKSFDADCNGYGRGEGGGVLLLKRLSDALKDGDKILGLVRASVMNHDGHTSGITVPSRRAQVEMMEMALEKSNISLNEVDYIEAHGTGTPTGDPIEIDAIATVYKNRSEKVHPLYVGSCKANIGHTEATAGIASIMKVLLCMEHKKLPKQPLLKKLNPQFQFNPKKMQILQDSVEFSDQYKTMIAGISGYGFSGTNVHLLLEEYPQPKEKKSPNRFQRNDFTFFLSAQTKKSLFELLRSYFDFLSSGRVIDETSLEYSLVTARARLKYCILISYGSILDLIEKIQRVLESNSIEEILFQPKRNLIFDLDISNFQVSKLPFYRFFQSMEPFQKIISKNIEKFSHSLSCDVRTIFHQLLENSSEIYSFNIKEEYQADFIINLSLLEFFRQIGIEIDKCISTHIPGRIASQFDSKQFLKEDVERYLLDGSIQVIDPVEDLSKNRLIYFDDSSSLRKERACYGFSSKNPYRLFYLLYADGASINWRMIYSQDCLDKIYNLPTYAFDNQSYWYKQDQKKNPIRMLCSLTSAFEGIKLPSPEAIQLHYFHIDKSEEIEIEDTHGILHVGYIQLMILSMMNEASTFCLLKNLNFQKALYFEKPTLQVVGTQKAIQKNKNHYKFTLCTQYGDEWIQHVEGSTTSNLSQKNLIPLETWKAVIDFPNLQWKMHEDFYEMMSKREMTFGPSVSCIDRYALTPDFIVAELSTPFGNSITPGLYDAIAQLFHLNLDDNFDTKLMVEKWGEYYLKNSTAFGPFLCVIQKSHQPPESIEGNVYVYDRDAELVFYILNQKMQKLQFNKKELASEDRATILLELSQLSENKKLSFIQDVVTGILSDLLKTPKHKISPCEGLYDLGFDSIIAIGFRSQLESIFEVDCEMSFILGNPTIESIAQKISNQIQIGKSSKNTLPQDSSVNHSIWLKGFSGIKASKKLFCFPYGGGGASTYLGWQKFLSGTLEVIPVQLPGREDRLNENPIGSINELCGILMDIILKYSNDDFAFYGHSMGAYVAFYLSLQMQRNQTKIPSQLFLSAASSPSFIPNPWSVHAKKLLGLLKKFVQLKGHIETFNYLKDYPSLLKEFPELEHPDSQMLLKKLLPVLEKDLEIVKDFEKQSLVPVDVPIFAFSGTRDDRVTVDEMDDWKKWTNCLFAHHILEGDHFFLNKDQKQQELLQIIEKNFLKNQPELLLR